LSATQALCPRNPNSSKTVGRRCTVFPMFPNYFEWWVAPATSRLQVNCLATFYRSLLLRPMMQRTAQAHYPIGSPNTLSKPHLTIVSSGARFFSQVPARNSPAILTAINDPKGFNSSQRYHDTKAMEIVFVKELSDLVANAGSGPCQPRILSQWRTSLFLSSPQLATTSRTTSSSSLAS
jgi:hypothetical protein